MGTDELPFEDRELFDPVAADAPAWEPVDGYPDGVAAKFLYDAGDRRSYLVRFPPNVEMSGGRLRHDHYEECVILEGAITDVGGDETATYAAGTYTSRTPGMVHGPYATGDEGCLIFVHEFDASTTE